MATFCSDTFTGDVADLISHTGETGATWTKATYNSGVIGISGGKALCLASNFDWLGYLASGTGASAEYDVETEYEHESSADADNMIGIFGRGSTSNPGYVACEAWFASTIALQHHTNEENFTTLGSWSHGFTDASVHDIKLEIRDAAKKVFVDGVERISSSNNSITAAGRVGFFGTSKTGGATTNHKFLSFTASDPASGGTDYTLTADAGSYALSGQAAGLRATRNIVAAQGSYALTGQTASLEYGRKLAAGQGEYSLSGQAAGLRATRKIAAATGSYGLTGEAANLLRGYLLNAATGTYSLSGQDAALVYAPNSGAYTLVAETGTYTMAGQDAGLLADRILTADQGAYVLTGQEAQVIKDYLLTAGQGSYSLSGQVAGLVLARVLNAETGSFTLTGQDVTFVWSGQEIPETPDGRIYVIPTERRIYVMAAESRTVLAEA